MRIPFVLPLALFAACACQRRQQAAEHSAAAARNSAPAASSSAALNPFAAATPVAEPNSRFAGRIVQRLDAGSYVYLEVDKPGSGPTWVVTAEALAPDADRVVVHVIKRVEQFESKRLKRTFAPLGFAVVRKDES